ncbi:MAG: aerobic carbon-monoxide dehydrogenase small subunit [Clostridiales bacterium]|nr:aerobic carbon-monoxide dehydrogenase small subunit [Clostridiales bacterium]
MLLTVKINDQEYQEEIAAGEFLIDFLRRLGYKSVKRGCETSNCGACSVLVNGKVVLSCSSLAASVNGKEIKTLEGLQEETDILGAFIAEEGADQCGYCTPGFMMAAIALKREIPNPSEDEIKAYLAGNLCRCTGYMGQLRAIKKYLEVSKC